MPRGMSIVLAVTLLITTLIGSGQMSESTVEAADAYSIVYSSQPNWSNPIQLHGGKVSGTIYPFLAPATNVQQVVFRLDGVVVQTENNAPYDFAGGSPSKANPWDTKRVSDGTHTIRATVTRNDGSKTDVQATFTVANSTSAPSPTPTPTPAPPTSGDQAGKLCSEATHNSYTATGPDGRQYPTWHPKVDKATGCYFGHEHGNDPASVAPGFQPLYGHVNHHHGMDESHHGFKTYAFSDGSQNIEWIISHHQGTTTRNALCGRHHAVNVVAYRDGVKMADLSLMGDFGTSRFADTNNYMKPPECANQGQIKSQGLRRIPESRPGDEDGYTPYILNGSFAALGLRMNANFLTTDGRTGCENTTCAELHVNEDNTGSRRRFQVLGNGVSINQVVKTTNSGNFCTDGSGTKTQSCDSAGAVHQYINPGFSTDLRVARHDRDGAKRNGMWYFNGENGPMGAAVDNGKYQGADPLLPLNQFHGAN